MIEDGQMMFCFPKGEQAADLVVWWTMSTALFAITAIESELYEWPKPPIWNGLHVYDKGALHLVRVTAKAKSDSIVGYGFNGGTAATRPQELFPRYVDMFLPQLIGRTRAIPLTCRASRRT